MLEDLRFVASAVAKKDYVAELTHFRIKGGRISGYNGVISLSSDIAIDIDTFPSATKFIQAIRACDETIQLNMTPGGKLAVKSGKFRSFVDCLQDEPLAFVEPEGVDVPIGEFFMAGIKKLAPLMGVDASRPWSMGIKLHGHSMYVTNNTMLAEYWVGDAFPLDVVIPAVCIEELLRIGQNPTRVQLTENSISFWFGEHRWLRSQLLEGSQWPAQIPEILASVGGNTQPFADGFFEAVAKLKPFLNEANSVYLGPDFISTSKDEGEGTIIEQAATGMDALQAYHHRNLVLLEKAATAIDWSTYPRPCGFKGDRLRGVIVGQRV